MLSLINSYLLQTARATLPYIGHFEIKYKPAINDNVNKKILPPGEEIIFKEEMMLLSPHLVKFIAFKKNIAEIEAKAELDRFCRDWKEKLEAGNVLCFGSFGCLQKGESGKIFFSAYNDHNPYYDTVDASRVLNQGAEHAILVGDVETPPVAMPGYYNEEAVVGRSSTWLIWALVLFVGAVIILLYSFYDHRWSTGSIGNRNHNITKTAGETHSEPSN